MSKLSSPETAGEPLPVTVPATLPGKHALGVEIAAVDLLGLSDAAVAKLKALVYEHKLVVLRGQQLDTHQYIAWARRLGEPQIYFQPNYHHPDHPEIFVSSNREMNGRKVGVAGTGRYWHTDYQFMAEPLPLTMVYPQELPNRNRETWYIDMQRVLAALPAELRRFTDGTSARHEAKWRYKVQPCDVDKSITELLEEFGAITPTVSHPTVIQHPLLDRQLLYVSRGFTVGLEGLGYEQGKAALAQLFDFIERPEHVHTHPWRLGDILLWDNRQLVHMASKAPPGQPSVSFRIGVYDGLPFYTNGRQGDGSTEAGAR